jgi:AcrR family transcriptional regulator
VRYAEPIQIQAEVRGNKPVAPTKSLTRAPSLRDRHKDQTRRALRDSALKLFASQGYDATTIEEIAERAGVSTRTFFRYFPTKEGVLYSGERGWIQALVDAYPTQSTKLSDFDAMRVTLEGLAERLNKSRRSLLLNQRAAETSPTLRGLDRDHQVENTDVVARAIAARRGQDEPDEACSLLAAVALVTFRRALDNWLRGSASASLRLAITREFKLLAKQIAG